MLFFVRHAPSVIAAAALLVASPVPGSLDASSSAGAAAHASLTGSAPAGPTAAAPRASVPTVSVPAASVPAASPAIPGLTPQLIAAAAEAGLREPVLALGLRAHERVRAAGLTDRSIVTIVDFSRLSRERRLWVIDVATGEVLAHELVAHGRNSGGDQADRFSNRHGSYQSSLGTFVTGATYYGKHGRSLRLQGLDAGLNDNAAARAIVIHGADYVNEAIVGQLGRLGRSLGCPALSPAAARRVIDLIRDGTTFFAYYPSDELTSTFPDLDGPDGPDAGDGLDAIENSGGGNGLAVR